MDNTNYDQYADSFLALVKNYIDEEMKSGVKIVSAIVSNVNSDGTVDVYFPPNKTALFTKIQNQSIYQDLKSGDGVKILYPNGKESSCWIVAKHNG